IDHRRRRGTVWVYDPTGTSGQPPSDWSPLDACSSWQGATRTAAWMVEAAQPRRDSLSDGDYWYGQARKALAPYLLAGHVAGAGLSDLVRWIDTQERTEVERALQLTVDRASRGRVVPAGGEVADDVRWNVLREATISMTRAYLRSVTDERRVLADLPTDQWPLEVIGHVEDVVEA